MCCNIINHRIKVTGNPLSKGHQRIMGWSVVVHQGYPNSSSPFTLPLLIRQVAIKEADVYMVWYDKAAWRPTWKRGATSLGCSWESGLLWSGIYPGCITAPEPVFCAMTPWVIQLCLAFGDTAQERDHDVILCKHPGYRLAQTGWEERDCPSLCYSPTWFVSYVITGPKRHFKTFKQKKKKKKDKKG